MGTIRTLTVTLTITLIAGCYSAARPTPKKAELPELVDGGKLDVDVRTVRYWSDSQWRFVRGMVADSMSYNEVPLTYHQARTLADPAYNEKLEEHRSLVKRCKRASIPRYIGYASVLAGGILMYYGGPIFKDNATLHYTVAGSALGVGALAYTTGYVFLGGRACGEANEIAEKLHFGKGSDAMKLYSDEVILEMSQVAAMFNKRMERAAHAKKSGDDTVADEPTEP